jgi:hypothetical protein
LRYNHRPGIHNAYRHDYFELSNAAAGSIALLSEAEVDTAVIFVHGFLGDPLGTWAKFHDLMDDCGHDWWHKCDVFFYRYASFEHQVADLELPSWPGASSSARGLARRIAGRLVHPTFLLRLGGVRKSDDDEPSA